MHQQPIISRQPFNDRTDVVFVDGADLSAEGADSLIRRLRRDAADLPAAILIKSGDGYHFLEHHDGRFVGFVPLHTTSAETAKGMLRI